MADDELVELIALDVAELKKKVTGLESGINDIAELLGVKDPAFLLSPWWFPRMLKSEADEAWKALAKWVDTVMIPRYDRSKAKDAPGNDLRPPAGEKLERCWFAHTEVVDQLAALFWGWLGDYKRNAPTPGPLEWQLNWLPKFFRELNLGTCQGGCAELARTGFPGTKSGEVTRKLRATWFANDCEGRAETR